MLLFHPDCTLHVCYPCMICINRYVTAVIVTGHHGCIMPLRNSVTTTTTGLTTGQVHNSEKFVQAHYNLNTHCTVHKAKNILI